MAEEAGYEITATEEPRADREQPRAEVEAETEAPWHPIKRIIFRFLCIYFIFYASPVFLFFVPTGPAWDAAVPWVSQNILNLAEEITIRPNGSGDTTYNYVQLFIMFAVSLAGMLIWTLLDWKRPHYRGLARWLTIACRYYLAFYMLVYGFGKVFKLQFPYPSIQRLLQPYGDSSPMGLVWTFMGYSKAYNIFTGGGEILAGLLLLFRRTTTLGALVTFAVMSNVAMLNFSYDVPVKLFSSHLILMAIVLMFPDLKRLWDVLVLNRPTKAREFKPLFANPMLRLTAGVFKTLLIGFILVMNLMNGASAGKQRGDQQEKPPLYGLYDIKTFIRDGEILPPLVTDNSRWRRFLVERRGHIAVQLMDGKFQRFAFDINEKAKTFTLSAYERYAGFKFNLKEEPEKKEPAQYSWSYSQPSAEVLLLEGEFEGAELSLELVARDPEDFLLVQRGYHWINETPFNR